MRRFLTILLIGCFGQSGFAQREEGTLLNGQATLALKKETRLKNLAQLTFGGENAEAYFSFAGDRLIFQSTRGNRTCDQIFIMGIDGTGVRRVSNGEGKTTCSYFLPGDEWVIFSSTLHRGPDCPPRPEYRGGYVWPLDDYDIYTARADGSDLRPLVQGPSYDAEATVSPKGDKIVFTSDMDGDLEIYSMNLDGSGIKRLTNHSGYDGGPFFSPDGMKIVYRAQDFQNSEEEAHYQDLLNKRLVEPTRLDIFVMDADGSNKIRLTDNGAANFCPFFHPSGQKIIFSSNMDDPRGRNFELYMIDMDGSGLERITYFDGFDGFPMFSPDGKRLVFASNRNNQKPHETNIFLADWVD